MESQQLQPPPETIGNYAIIEPIGKGGFSRVYKALALLTDTNVAIKIIPKTRIPEHILQREIKLLKMLDHPFCNKFYEMIEDETNWYIVTELITGGTVLAEINKNRKLNDLRACMIFNQLISALDYLHNELHIAHRDLKAENIMVDRYGNIRLIDFGLGNTFSEDKPVLATACGSPAYAPPEMLRGEAYTFTADIWSAGVVLYTMVIGKLPFNDINFQRLATKIVCTEPEYPDNLSIDLKNLLSRLLDKDGKTRTTISEIRKNHWFCMYQYSNALQNSIGSDYRFISRKGDVMIDKKILDKLTELGLHIEDIVPELQSKQCNDITAPYHILKREKITELLNSNFGQIKQENSSPARLTTHFTRKAFVPLPAGPFTMKPGSINTTPLAFTRLHKPRSNSNAEVFIADPALAAAKANFMKEPTPQQNTSAAPAQNQLPHAHPRLVIPGVRRSTHV